MHISRVELENIKSHANSVFDLSPGTTAIMGSNGAGKTTIIEAIAWALFDLLEYKKEDFIRRGAKKGIVRITFFSGLDEREYTVYRDTGTGYYVTDPRLGTRIADKREEVHRFLWQHLGLEPGSDLKSLFRQAIGVPQGTFTAIFLEGATDRKIAFDRLLKIEEYRQAADKLRDTSKFLANSIANVRERIARHEGELARAESVQQEHDHYAEQAVLTAAELKQIEVGIGAVEEKVRHFDELAQRLNQSRASLDSLKLRHETASQMLEQRRLELERSEEAARAVAVAKAGAESHVKTLRLLQDLDRERGERDRIRAEIAKIDAAMTSVTAERRKATDDLESAVAARTEIQSLREALAEQSEIEQNVAAIREKLLTSKAAQLDLQRLDDRLERLRQSYASNRALLKEAEERSAMAAELTALEARSGELMQGLAMLQASLERDQIFQNEIKNGLCPVLSQKCLNLKEGETLEGFVSGKFTGLRSQIATLEAERSGVTARLALAREAARAASAVDALRTREREFADEGQFLRSEREKLAATASDTEALTAELAAAEARLALLDDPRSRVRFLEERAIKEAASRQCISDIERNVERLESDRRIFVEQIEPYLDLDERWAALTTERTETEPQYKLYLEQKNEAEALDRRKAEYTAAQASVEETVRLLASSEQEFARANAAYDELAHSEVKARYSELQQQRAATAVVLKTAETRAQQLAGEITRFEALRRSLQQEFREKERLENVSEATDFIRDTLKEAAPRVARNYVYHVSIEANQIFREITGNAERTLRWQEDYSVTLEEAGYERSFASLSGGEQMAAALSIRLGLLKQLSNIRVAFFDEPTTNLDLERRENLAAQIGRISHFDQLFVISHDDTFEEYVDRTLHIEAVQ